MLAFSRIQAAAGALVFLMAAGPPAHANQHVVQNLGPVGPHEPILTTVGSKRIIAFYSPDRGNCAVHVVEWNSADVNAESTAGFQTSLSPGQMAAICSAESGMGGSAARACLLRERKPYAHFRSQVRAPGRRPYL